MSTRDGSLTRFWGDGIHRFCLPIGQLVELEDKCNAGLPEIAMRILGRRWRTNDLREIIRLGLIGGGMSPSDAHMKMLRYFDPPERPKIENVEAAVEILSMALQGPPDEPLGKAKPAGENATTETTTGGPDGPTSTARPPPSGSDLVRSTNGHSGNSSP